MNVRCQHCGHEWVTQFSKHCKCPGCGASQYVADMALAHKAARQSAPVTVAVNLRAPAPSSAPQGRVVPEAASKRFDDMTPEERKAVRDRMVRHMGWND